MSDELVKLSRAWFDIVSVDHHKDRDCHFAISKRYSYGNPPYYSIEHYGYIAELPEELAIKEYTTYKEAYKSLVEWIKGEVVEMLGFYKEIEKQHDYNSEGAKEVFEYYKDYYHQLIE